MSMISGFGWVPVDYWWNRLRSIIRQSQHGYLSYHLPTPSGLATVAAPTRMYPCHYYLHCWLGLTGWSATVSALTSIYDHWLDNWPQRLPKLRLATATGRIMNTHINFVTCYRLADWQTRRWWILLLKIIAMWLSDWVGVAMLLWGAL